MDYLYLELHLKTKYKLTDHEVYRLYANNDLLCERSIQFEVNSVLKEKIVLHPIQELELLLEYTNNNKFKITNNYLIISNLTINSSTIVISPNFRIKDPRILFPFSNKIKITV